MPQLAIQLLQPRGFAGQLADTAIRRIEGSVIPYYCTAFLPFGRFVTIDSAGKGIVSLPTQASDPIVGVTVMDEHYGAELATYTNPNGVQGYPANSQVSILTFGDIWMMSETAVNRAADSVLYRFAANGGLDQVGGVRASANTGSQAFARARFLESIAAPGLTLVNISR